MMHELSGFGALDMQQAFAATVEGYKTEDLVSVTGRLLKLLRDIYTGAPCVF